MPQVERLDPSTWTDSEWSRSYALHCLAHREQGTTPRPLEAYRDAHAAASAPGAHHTRSFVVCEGDKLVGKLDVGRDLAEPDVAVINLYVDPAFRRRGIGRQLLQEGLRQAEQDGARAVDASMYQPASWALCERFGGRLQRGGAQLSLPLARANWKLVDEWCRAGPLRSPHARLQELTDVPQALAGAFLALHNAAWADLPHASHLGPPLTLAQRREQERSYERQGLRWITLIAREPHGLLCGMTEVLYDPGHYAVARQEFTGVLPSHRGRGIAKWLKASMLRLIRNRFPAVSQVCTVNGDDNAPMLAINRRLGFGDPIHHRTYRFELGELKDAIGAPAPARMGPVPAAL